MVVDLKRERWEGPALTPGKHVLEFDFKYDGLGIGTLAFNSLSDTGTPVDDKDYQVPFTFTGKINKITLTIDRPKLTAEDEKKLMQAQRNNKTSE
jgi:hypothetical protein